MTLRGPGPGQAVHTPLASPVAEVAALLRVRKWFTTLRLVRTLFVGSSGSTDVQNEEVILVNKNRLALKNGNIAVDSERIKKRVSVLGPDAVTFTVPNTWTSLTQADLVRGSVQVFDSSESAVKMTEGADYEIDYKNGRIKRVQQTQAHGTASGAGAGDGSAVAIAAGSVTVTQSVRVHYEYHTAFIKDVDYQIQYQSGYLARLSQGSIINGERVYVDYRIDSNITEAMLTDMIDQAHTIVMAHVSAALEGTQADTLKYAETYFALSLLANAGAADMLEGRRSDDVDQAADALVRLSDRYERKAWEFLAPHLTARIRRAGGKVGRNVSW